MEETSDAGHNNSVRIPEATKDFYDWLVMAGYPKGNLIPEIVSDENMSDSFDYVIGHLEHEAQRAKYRPHKQKIVAQLQAEIRTGTFRIERTDVRDLEVYEGGKWRDVQAPKVNKRVGCHAIMVVVERVVAPTLITNTGASIKGRGMHWLFHRTQDAIKALGHKNVHYYQSDYHHYYESIDQQRMTQEIRRYIRDATLLPILDNLITLLPVGLSKGLRSSQCFANLYHSPTDHYMNAEVGYVEVETCDAATSRADNAGDRTLERMYLLFRYMDDIVILTDEDKRELWRDRDILAEQSDKYGLRIKPSECVRPLSDGLNFLGYINFGTHALLRKRTKVKAARKLAKVKSRKRRQEIIGSFKGMACHADCKHLYKSLTNQTMKKFSEMGVNYTPADGKKRFPGRVKSLGSILNMAIEVHDYEADVSTKHGSGRYIVSFKEAGKEEWFKFFTASEEMKSILDQIGEMDDGFPFETTITVEHYDGGKRIYRFT